MRVEEVIKINRRHRIIYLAMLLAMLVILSAFMISRNLNTEEVEEVEVAEVEAVDFSKRDSLTIPSYTIKTKEVTDGKVYEEILRCINEIRNNHYVQVKSGENKFEGYYYNKNGECFSSDYDGTVTSIFRHDGKVIKYLEETSLIAIGNDVDVLNLSENAVLAVKNRIKGSRLLEVEDGEIREGLREYKVDLYGEDAVRACYSEFGYNFSNNMIKSLKDQIGKEEWEPHLILSYIINDKNELSIYCNFVLDNTEYSSWATVGYIETKDWKLPGKWYSKDLYEFIHEDYDSMIEELNSIISDVIEKE